MIEEKNTRQLAAVMFTDMVGYTALMQENEAKARADRDRHREVLERLVKEHYGRILQYFGDGTLCVFDSAMQALMCALEIQKELQREPEIPVRIGLHAGEIVYEENGVYGDAVNVAARIEAISVPGGVLFSSKVLDDVKNHPQFQYISLGEFKFKNVKRPIEVFALANSMLNVPTVDDLKGKVPTTIKSVAVLPFVNMSADPENEYFSEGISEELIDAFAKVEGLHVTARTSSFAFKGKNMDIREIGSKLGVDTILEGSVRKAGNRVRVTAQLVDTRDGYHLFSETFDRNLEDIFAVQDEIALNITHKLTHHINSVGIRTSLVKSPTDNLDAYNLYLKGLYNWTKWTPDNIKKAIEFFEQAIEMEPDFASAYSAMASTYIFLGATGTLLPEIAYPRAQENAQKALALDAESHHSHIAIGMVKLFYDWDWEGAEKSIQRGLQLKPGSGNAHYYYGIYLQAVGRLEESIIELEQAVRLDPLSLPINNFLSFVLYYCERYDDALRQTDKVLELDAGHRAALEIKGWVLLMKGETEKAVEILEKYHSMTGSELKGVTALGVAYVQAGRIEEARQCLEKMHKRQQLEENVNLGMDFVVLYTALGELDTAFSYMEKAIEARLGGIFFTKNNPALKAIRQDPRFKTMLAKLGLKG
jgi:TolB-like protein/Tfp pilus assembly protein PilF